MRDTLICCIGKLRNTSLWSECKSYCIHWWYLWIWIFSLSGVYWVVVAFFRLLKSTSWPVIRSSCDDCRWPVTRKILIIHTADKTRSIMISKIENWSVDQIQLAQKRGQWDARTKTAMDVLTLHNEVNFLSNWAASGLIKKILLRGVSLLGGQLVCGV
jgi:hypothetical protein